MSKKTTYARLIAYGIPFLILGGMTIKPLLTTISGQDIMLETKPIDPRDLFRGDHVLLSLEIENAPFEKLHPSVQKRLPTSDLYGDNKFEKFTVYSILNEQSGVYELKEVVLNKPKKGVYLKGSIHPLTASPQSKDVTIQYDIDRYFVPENTGKELEKKTDEGKALVLAKVKNGYPVIQKVVVK